MKKLCFCLFWIVFVGVSFLGEAQTLDAQLRGYADKQPQEQILLQLSEGIVGAGELIWFQANITYSDSSAVPSRVVYLELFNQQQVAVVQGIYSASSGVATGQLAIPDSLGGWYQLRAYTQAMRNGNPLDFFTQPVLVVNTSVSNPTSTAQTTEPGIKLYSEGGNWLANQENNGLVWVPDSASFDARLEVIQATDSMTVASTLIRNNLGSFTFTPLADSSYIARIVATDTTYLQLPPAKPNGYSLRASLEGGNLKITGNNSSSDNAAFLVVRSRNRLFYYQPAEQNLLSATWPTSELSGLVKIAVLTNQGEELAQRLVYIENQTSGPTLELSSETVSPREEMNITVSGNTDLGEALLSLTVRKIRFPKHPLSVTALDHFGISNLSLPGNISTEENLPWINDWLVTQTVSWPALTEILSQKLPLQNFVKEDEMLLVTGSIQIPQPFDEEDQVLLSVPGDNPYFEYSEITSDGRFAIPVSRVYGTQNSILQYRSATDELPQTVQWEIDSMFAPPPTNQFYPPVFMSDDEWQQLTDNYQLLKRIKQTYFILDEDTIEAPTKPKDQFRFYGAPNTRVDPDNYISLPSFEEICRELLPGVRLIKRKGNFNFDVFDPGTRNFLPNEPALLLDGIPIQDKDYIINFPPDQISYIETVNRRTYYGNFRLDGVIAVYTKQEKAYEEALSTRAHFTNLSYYTPSASFSPPDSLTTSLPDFRTLHYWKPKINEDSTFTFTTSDELGTYEAVIQGVTKEGKIIYKRDAFTVKPADLP